MFFFDSNKRKQGGKESYKNTDVYLKKNTESFPYIKQPVPVDGMNNDDDSSIQTELRCDFYFTHLNWFHNSIVIKVRFRSTNCAD